MWAIARNEDGHFAARSGSQHSYTRDPRQAQRYSTREAARAECCGNEHPVNLLDWIGA